MPTLAAAPDWVTPGGAILAGSAAFALYYVFKVTRFLLKPYFSPLRNLPGPRDAPSFIFGHMNVIFKAEASVVHEKWVQEYGPTFVYKGFFGSRRLFTMDPRGVAHVLNNSYVWQKPAQIRRNLAQILGEGVLFVEGDKHKSQRRILNPAFGTAQIREFTSTFLESSSKLRDIWLAKASEVGGPYRVDALSWLSKATLDIIGLSGFNYRFDALDETGKSNELSDAFGKVFSSAQGFRMLAIMKNIFPILRIIPEERERQTKAAMATMNRIGDRMIEDKKRAILASTGGVQAEKKNIVGRDLLSLLIKANMATDIPPNQRMSDEDVRGQIPTFLVAGHETTSSSTTWCLYALSKNQVVQKKLREELLAVDTETPSMDVLNNLPYLDMVVRETLRVHSVVTNTIRIAETDDIIPLSTPFTDRHGKVHTEIQVKKGDSIFVPILALNRSPDIWGPDAYEFNPDRWIHPPEKSSGIPGVIGGLMTFLGGPRSCIGWRFAVVEMKALLFHLMRTFQIELAVPVDQIQSKSTIVARPVVDGKNELPLLITPLRDL